jgi:Lipopolysaccharide-assembly
MDWLRVVAPSLESTCEARRTIAQVSQRFNTNLLDNIPCHALPRRAPLRENPPPMTKVLRASLFILMLAFVSGFAECYKPVTKNQLPARIKTVAVPAFQMESQALRYKVESRFTEAVMRELVHRGRGLRVQGDREGADAVIEGVIKSFYFGGVLLDDKGRARIFEVTIAAAVTVRDQTENRVLYDNQNFVFRGEYEFASDPRSFFNEEDPAILRMSRSFAESIVSTLINAVQLEKK